MVPDSPAEPHRSITCAHQESRVSPPRIELDPFLLTLQVTSTVLAAALCLWLLLSDDGILATLALMCATLAGLSTWRHLRLGRG